LKPQNISLSPKDKMVLVSNFSTMLSAGISILEAVDSLLEDAKGNQKDVLAALRADLIQGKHVYSSFAQFPKIFDKVTLNILKASEEAGTLDVALKDLKGTIKKQMEFGDSLKSALIYPILISVVFIGVLLMILLVVVPKISTVFLRLRVTLPLPTRVLIFMSETLLQNTIPFLIGFGLVVGLFILLFKTRKQMLLNMFFSLPIINELVKQIDLAQFSRSLYLLLNAGIPITTALEFAEEVVKRPDIRKILYRARDKVIAGTRFSEGLKEAKGVIPYIMIKIIEAGEKTGTLDRSMQDISDYLDYEVTNSLKTVTALIEPVMLVMVGIMVGGMMMAIIAPIYGLIGQVGGH
jgi:type II secretory pathway component PulF